MQELSSIMGNSLFILNSYFLGMDHQFQIFENFSKSEACKIFGKFLKNRSLEKF
jgi:hypothetical protein